MRGCGKIFNALIFFWLLSGSGWVAHAAVADVPGFNIKSAELVNAGNDYALDADIDFSFSNKAIEALAHGVPLTVTVRVVLQRIRKFIWNKKIADVVLPYRLRYHALAKRYRVINTTSGVERNFASLDAAIKGLGTIRDVPIIEVDRLDSASTYEVSLKTQLDIEALPLPLRPVAYVTPSWYLGSGWYTWLLDE